MGKNGLTLQVYSRTLYSAKPSESYLVWDLSGVILELESTRVFGLNFQSIWIPVVGPRVSLPHLLYRFYLVPVRSRVSSRKVSMREECNVTWPSSKCGHIK